MITQQTFNTIYLGLQAQGWRQSYDREAFMCAYRGANNHKCAIGHLIPDDQYVPKMDDFVAGVLGYDWFKELNFVPELTRDEFNGLQACHDNNVHPDEMKAAFITFGQKFGLEIPAP
ncbi:hypothetical protein [Mesorhizobium sp. B2-4-1]|uniref:hypothetical protein n=1 Tax=Mesorhizobium sp. B2-4-1 TaxID=2589948 RepID=UPI001127F26D|nr:hypothetical protein [Mesorhizobium sp. B2-4-1]TPL66593.1 hypothetical protein FJ949_09510 [Mesorhizobium sp. B2-4-1]